MSTAIAALCISFMLFSVAVALTMFKNLCESGGSRVAWTLHCSARQGRHPTGREFLHKEYQLMPTNDPTHNPQNPQQPGQGAPGGDQQTRREREEEERRKRNDPRRDDPSRSNPDEEDDGQ